MRSAKRLYPLFFPARIIYLIYLVRAEPGPLGEVQFVSKASVEKTSGVWIDGQYVGYVGELKEDKKVLLLPGEHEISLRQSGYMDFTQKVVVEPGKKVVLHVTMQKDPRAQFLTITSQLKLQVTPDRAAVFVDDGFVGTVREF